MRKFLEECYNIEKLVAKTYQKFSENEKYPTTVREIFREMAEDEMEHARIIDMVIQTPGYELGATASLTEEQVDEKLRHTKALLVISEHSELSASDALKLALEAEAQLLEVHANHALIPGDQSLTKFFSTLSQYDSAHVDKLRSCLDSCQA